MNHELATVLEKIAGYYRLVRDAGRARAFSNAALAVHECPYPLTDGGAAAKALPGIGQSIATVITEFATTGNSSRLTQLEEQYQETSLVLNQFLAIYGIGTTTALRLYEEGCRTLGDIWARGQLTEAQRQGILWRHHLELPIERAEIEVIRGELHRRLSPYGIKWEIAGSYRRGEPRSGDIDVLVEERPSLNMAGLVLLLRELLPVTLAQGETKFMGIIRLSERYNGHRIDIRLVSPVAYPVALLYFTGSSRFNVLLRQRALDRGYSLNEYSLTPVVPGDPVAPQFVKEEELFQFLGVQYLPPSERRRDLAILPLID
jgi:DNA polymerase beta